MLTAPTGTLTFLFTDIEGSSSLWEARTAQMSASLQQHDRILRTGIEGAGGYVFKTVGDAFDAVFSSPAAAVTAALTIQAALSAETWEGPALCVRMAIHTGESECRDGDYFGPTLNRVARLLGCGHGGQVLVSQAAFALVQDELPQNAVAQSLGVHRLKDLHRAEEVFQLSCAGLVSQFPPLRSLDARPHNLPVQLTSFVGREDCLAEVRALLGATRLLTLTGSGGTGKTRLALQAAGDLLDEFEDGAWLVELAPLSEAERLPEVVTRALAIPENPSQPSIEMLTNFVRHRKMLLILDNCEHLLAGCSSLTEHLLGAAPRLRIIATSREPLGIAGETTMTVPSLSLPQPSDVAPTAESLGGCESARLFCERARAVDPHFDITDASAASVSAICTRLDGVPLAIELAAARVRVLSVGEIAERLVDRFRLLTGGSRSALPRQQTLRATVDWSYQLLAEDERVMLRWLSVFSGGWDLEAAETVCSKALSQNAEVLDVLTRLVERSLVVVEHSEPVRYRFLETIRQYAREKLLEAGEVELCREAHFDWAVGIAEALDFATDWSAAFARVGRERDNLRSALEWARADTDPPVRFLRLLGALWFYWAWGSFGFAEGQELAEEALRRSSESDRGRMAVLNCAGLLAGARGDWPRALEAHRAAYRLARTVGDRNRMVDALAGLGWASWRTGALRQAHRQLEAARHMNREMYVTEPRAPTVELFILGVMAAVLSAEGRLAESAELLQRVEELGRRQHIVLPNHEFALGEFAREQGRWAEAERYYTEALALARVIGMQRLESTVLVSLAHVACGRRTWRSALPLLSESMRLSESADYHFGMWSGMVALAKSASLAGAAVEAARALGAGQEHGIRFDRLDQRAQERIHADLVGRLGDDAFGRAYAEGRAMTQEAALDFARRLIRDLEALSSRAKEAAPSGIHD